MPCEHNMDGYCILYDDYPEYDINTDDKGNCLCNEDQCIENCPSFDEEPGE